MWVWLRAVGVVELCRACGSTPRIRSLGLSSPRTGEEGSQARQKDWGWETCFGKLGILSQAPSKKDAESMGVLLPRWGPTSPHPSSARLGGSGRFSVSWTINAMHWSSKIVAVFLCLFFYLCC